MCLGTAIPFKMWKHRRRLDTCHFILIIINIILSVRPAATDPCSDVTAPLTTPSGDSCYYVPEDALTWTRARRECERLQSRLAVVTSSEAMDAVRTLVDGGGVDDVWLGAAEQGTGGYVWDEGTALTGPLDNYPWADLNDVTQEVAGSRQNCVFMDGNRKWSPGPCAATSGFICQFDAANQNCFESAGSDVITLGGACFLLQYGDFSWFRARAQCVSLGGHMTRFENQTLYSRLSTQLKVEPLYRNQQLWTGLRKSRWVWVTGVEMVMSFWEQSQPAGTGTCLSARRYTPSTVLWRAQACSTTSRFVCQKDLPAAVTVTPTTGSPNPTANGPSGLSTGLLLILLLLLAVLAVITVFLFCYYRRGRALRKAARNNARKQRLEQQRNEAPRDPYQTNFSIFTCDSAPRDTSQYTQHSTSATNGHVSGLTNGMQHKPNKPNGHSQQLIEADALLQNNNNPKQNLLNNSMRQKKKITKNASKYSDPVDSSYDFDAEEAALRPEKGSDSDNVFKDIRNLDPPVLAHKIEDEYSLPADHRTRQNSEHVYEEPVDSQQGFKRDMDVYQSGELFAVRTSMRKPSRKEQVEDSLVFESIQADDVADTNAGEAQQSPSQEAQDAETDRSKYIEDVAKAFDFLVSGDGVSESNATPLAAHPSAPAALPPIAAHPTTTASHPSANDTEGKLLKRRGRKDSIRSQGREGSDTDGEKIDSDMAKAQRRLYGEKERAGSRRKKEKPEGGQVNGGYAGTDSELDDEKRRKRHKQRLGREGTAGTDTELEDEKKRKKSHNHRHGSLRHNYTEEELEEKKRRRKERERQKQEQRNKEQKFDMTDDDDIGLTRVGSPIGLGKLPPLVPNTDNKSKEKKHREHREHREHRKHRKDKKDMTPEEREERRRRHKRKKERQRRKELANQAQPSRIQVQGKPEEEEDESGDSDTDSGEETPGSVSGSVAGTPKKETPNSSARGSSRGRRGSSQGSHQVYDIENTGAGDGIEV